jgi:N-acetylated-alpha-linked acidic dipeptidase
VRGVSAGNIGRTSRRLSRRPQLIDTPGVRRTQRISVRKLRRYGFDVSTPEYSVYASRPNKVEVTMTAPERHRLSSKEQPFPWHEDFDQVVDGYNAYSPSGDVAGEVVYANFGLPEDYAALDALGVSVAGKIVLVRYGGSFRGVKAQQAELRGAKGLLIYSDPEDDGFVKGPVYPDGPWRPADGIQRGSIQYIFNYPGDPLTPGVPALAGTPRLDPADAGNLPHIPPPRSPTATPGRCSRGSPVRPRRRRSGAGCRSPTTWARAERRSISTSTSPTTSIRSRT